MKRDYAREVARVWGEHKPVQELGQRVIAEIDGEMRELQAKVSDLQQQITMIRMFMATDAAARPNGKGSNNGHAPEVKGTGDVSPMSVADELDAVDQEGAAEAERARIMEIAMGIVAQKGHRKSIPPDVLLRELDARGIKLDVTHPRSVAGSFLYRAKMRARKNADVQGSLLKPAEAGKS